MVIVMKADASSQDIERVQDFVNNNSARAHISQGEERTIIGVIGFKHQVRREHLLTLAGVEKVIPISKPYKLVSREFKRDNTIIHLNGVAIGNGTPVIIPTSAATRVACASEAAAYTRGPVGTVREERGCSGFRTESCH